MIKKILTSLILSVILITTVQAAMGIPKNLMPKNTPLKGLNQTITEEVKANGQDGAVTGANIVLQYLANILLFFAAPLAVLFLARAAADYAFAMGEDSKLESAKRELTWSLVGLVLVMFSYLLVRLFIQPLSGLQTTTDAALEAQCQAMYKTTCAEHATQVENDKIKADGAKANADRDKHEKNVTMEKDEKNKAEAADKKNTEDKAKAAEAKAATEKIAAEQAKQAEQDAAAVAKNQKDLNKYRLEAAMLEADAKKAEEKAAAIQDQLKAESMKAKPDSKLMEQLDKQARPLIKAADDAKAAAKATDAKAEAAQKAVDADKAAAELKAQQAAAKEAAKKQDATAAKVE